MQKHKKKQRIKEINENIKRILSSFLNNMRGQDLKYIISTILPGLNIEEFVLKKIKKILRFKQKITLEKKLGHIKFSYKDGIKINFLGIISFFIGDMFISEEMIIDFFYDIVRKVQLLFLSDNGYFEENLDFIFCELNKIEIELKEKNEKITVHDLFVLIISNYFSEIKSMNYKYYQELDLFFRKKNKERNFESQPIADAFIKSVLAILPILFQKINKNIYVNYNILVKFKILVFFLNKKTEDGQILKLLSSFFNFNITFFLEKMIETHVTTSFINSLGLLLIETAIGKYLDDKNDESLNKINLTILPSTHDFSLNFSWMGKTLYKNKNNISYSEKTEDDFFEISEDKQFYFFNRLRPKKKIVKILRPIFNLGVIVLYKTSYRILYELKINNAKSENIYYYRIKNKIKLYENNFSIFLSSKNNKFNINPKFKFFVFSDSQGMIKQDYDAFLNLFDISINNSIDIHFIIHLGDFVDDGNNENYWDFLLNSPLWGRHFLLPVCGNHESKSNFSTPKNFNYDHPFFRHFSINGLISPNHQNDELYYYYIYKNTLFVVLNTNVEEDTSRALGVKQYKWAFDILIKTKTKFKIILTHKSVYSNSQHSKDKDIKSISSDIIELCALCGVDLVLSGHDHVYSRSSLLLMGKNVKINGEEENSKEGKIIYNSFDGINAIGTVFVTCGASGVKNYKTVNNVFSNNEVVLNLSLTYLEIEIDDSSIFLETKALNKEKNEIYVVDKLMIKKQKKIEIIEQNKQIIENLIENLPNCPWLLWDNKIQMINNYLEEETDYSDIKNIDRFIRFIEDNKTYKEILSSNIYIVSDEQTFLKAVKNPKYRQIILNCSNIKFRNFLELVSKKIFINHSLCIKGKCDFSNVNFVLKPGVTLIIDGLITITYKQRNIFNPYKKCAFKMNKDTTLILGQHVVLFENIPENDILQNIRVYQK